MRSFPCLSATTVLLFFGGAATAQDRRTVVEPRFPPACAVLEARLAAPAGRLPEADRAERRHRAHPGRRSTVALPARRSSSRDRGGERLPERARSACEPGVTLVVDAHTALFGSRNPRDYDVEPGSCGILADWAGAAAAASR